MEKSKRILHKLFVSHNVWIHSLVLEPEEFTNVEHEWNIPHSSLEAAFAAEHHILIFLLGFVKRFNLLKHLLDCISNLGILRLNTFFIHTMMFLLFQNLLKHYM